MKPDYTLYLVTDSTPAILKGQDLPTVVEQAIRGGATIVQYRDKQSSTRDLIRTAQKLHAVTKAHNIPLLINDRLDVALAIRCEGVHIGQDDTPLPVARRLLGPDAIIGVTANSVAEAVEAAESGADYLGLGTVFATPTKDDAKSIVGTAGLRAMLNALHARGFAALPTVCIGGIKADNCQRVLYQSQGLEKRLDGVAVVSAIVAAADPRAAAAELKNLLVEPPPFAKVQQPFGKAIGKARIVEVVPRIVKAVGEAKPLCHNMTNLVVQNIAANVAICIGASPIMSNNGLEAADLAKLGGALVINMGTVTPEGLENYIIALKAYNAVGGSVLFDPVGAGATEQRRNAVKKLMAGGYFDVIKGNENEIKTVAGTSGSEQQRGVDSGASTLSMEQKTKLVRDLARQERNVVVMTGKQDVVSDGYRTHIISNGHKYLGDITGSGCCLGTAIASFLAVFKEDRLLATIAAMLMFEIASERAAKESNTVQGPGTFVPAFLDELYSIRESSIAQTNWLHDTAEVEQVA